MFYKISFYTIVDDKKLLDMRITKNSYAEALKCSRKYKDHDLAIITDSSGQFVIARKLKTGELCV